MFDLNSKLDTVCRFCLSDDGQLYLLFGLHKDPNLVIQNVRMLTTIELSTSENINYKICETCCASFELCVKFRQTCVQAEKRIKELRSLSCLASASLPAAVIPSSEIKQELEPSPLEPEALDQLFNEDPQMNSGGLMDQYGLNFVTPPLFDGGGNWPEQQISGAYCNVGVWNSPESPVLPPIMGPVSPTFPSPTGGPQPTISTTVLSKLQPASSSLFASASIKISRSKYFCQICEKHFFQRNVHIQHHERYSKACFQCLDEKLTGTYRPEVALVGRHTCRICLAAKESCAEFLQHSIAHHAEEHRAKDSYKCNQCDKVFVLKGENSRGKVHNCVRKMHCPHCPQSFHYAKSYQKHLRFFHNVPADASELKNPYLGPG
ncbi:uncharacterized protein LOC129747467 [Uranotaenia lowii]|uniref:uncharacterized protein LOC129747467 n=1 Tax=Uranotaenia lowii TaxID=190385 RepID=UPI0024789D72|nr:uncharacterized protein LOC129747467 [Uranotaenia lowii]